MLQVVVTRSNITNNGINYTVYSVDYTDQVFHHIHNSDGEEVCVIGINDEGEWEALSNIDSKLVKELGGVIDNLAN